MAEELSDSPSAELSFRVPSGSGPVLVVDDDQPILRLFSRTLERAGFAVLTASNGREALDRLAEQQVSLVLLDSQMPVMSGLETLAEIRRRESSRTLPVIMVTGLTEIDDRVAGLAAGADDYVTKPVALEELVARVRSHLRVNSAWTDVVERGIDERRLIVQALREARTELTPGQTAQAMLAHLEGVLQTDTLACLRFTREGTAVPLAVTGALAAVLSPDVPIPPARATVLIERSEDGPWLQSWQTATPEDTYAAQIRAAGVLGTAYAPLRHGGELIGALVAAATGGKANFAEDDLARSLPSLIGFAELAGALLGPQLIAHDRTADARAALESIITARSFSPVYQPIVSLDSGRPIAYEALTRFDDGLRPDLRFKEADALGLGGRLEEACLAAAIEQAHALPDDMWLTVNVSPHFLLNGPVLSRLVTEAQRPVVVELTEHIRIEDYGQVRTVMAALGSDTRLAVDDMGAGVNNFQHIVELGPDIVKVDISLVHLVDTDPARRAIVRALVYIAEEIGLRLVAEGIETRGELNTLRGLGVHMGQGYLLGRPRPIPAQRVPVATA